MTRRPSLHVLLAAALFVTLVGPPAGGALVGTPVGRRGGVAEARDRTSTATPLVDRLAKRIAASGVRSGKLGVSVLSLDTGAPVMERDALLPLIPASVAKVATAAAALDLLGPGYVYETSLDARGTLDPSTGVLDGDLVLHGSGDPGLSRRGHEADPLWPLSVFAKAARDAGIRRVTGSLVLDDGPFDREFLHASWAASDLDDWYGAPVAGLSFNDACVTVRVRGASSDGDAATVTAPSTSGPWPLEGSVRTWSERRTEVGGLWADERHRLKVSGALPPRQEYEFETPVPDPLQFIGAALVQTLASAGVKVDGGARLARTPNDRAAGRPLAVIKNPLAATLKVMNKKSQNLYAELVFKACGAERFGVGSWTTGERAVLDALACRGLPVSGLRVVDGSGLSKENRLSAACLAGLLLRFDADPLRGPVLRDSLAVPGEDGTLEKRFREPGAKSRVRAKTGTLGRSGIHALAGFVDGTGGSRGYVFAILVNDGKVDAKDLMDDLVRELLEG